MVYSIMCNNFNLGILGCGMVGNYHIETIKKLIGSDRLYLCDLSSKILNNASKKYGVYNLIRDHFDFINTPEIDAIIVCTPPETHYELIIECLRANKHVLVEKPLVIDKEQLNKIESIIANYPDIMVIDCSARHSRLQPKFNFIKSIINQGLLGEVYYIHHNVVNRASRPGIEYHPNAKWFFQKELSGGGPLIDWGVYDIAFHIGILDDKPELVNVNSYLYSGFDSLSRDNTSFTVEEHAFCMLEFDTINYYYERASNAHNFAMNETRLYGSKGGLRFSYLSADENKIEFYYVNSQGHYKKEILEVNMDNHEGYKSDYLEMDKHFINCLQGTTTPILPISTTIKIMRIILEMYNNLTYKF